MSETLEERIRHDYRVYGSTRLTEAYASDFVEILDARDTELARLRGELGEARQEIANIAEKMFDGTLHNLHCSASRESLVGSPGCSCVLAYRIHAAEQRATNTEQALRLIESYAQQHAAGGTHGDWSYVKRKASDALAAARGEGKAPDQQPHPCEGQGIAKGEAQVKGKVPHG